MAPSEQRNLTCRKRICVIGAGTAGLVAAKVALEEGEGAEVVCLERAADLGGIWWYRPNEMEQTTVMEFTVTNTSKEMSAFSDYPPSASLPAYLPHRDMLAYLKDYARAFGVREIIRFNSVVEQVSKMDDGRWRVVVKDILTNTVTSEVFDAVMVCIGHHSIPRSPRFQDQHLFKGRIIHGKVFKNSDGYRGKRVAVVGFGNSAVDIAISLTGLADQVYISVRCGTWIYPSHSGGVPLDYAMVRRLTQSMPSIVRNFVLDSFMQRCFNHDIVGLTPEHSVASQMGTVNDQLPRALLAKQIRLMPPIQRFTESGVIFEDSDECVPVDEVILATGYRPDIPFVDSKYYGKCTTEGDVDRLLLFKGMYSLCDDSIVFLGMIDAQGNLGQLFEMQARHFMAVYSGRVRLPERESERMEAVAQNIAAIKATFVGDSHRHAIMVDKMRYMDNLAEDMGVKPNWWTMLIRDPQLALRCLVGPLLPYQYRLIGPYAWAGAREAIMTAESRQMASLQPKKPLPRTANRLHGPHSRSIRFSAVFVIISVCLLLSSIVIGSGVAWKTSYL
ncbi:dimethylaniline monooxygenase-like [Tropilaelaps mercedesae]|uniref:Flavin-containing monooxygenase n=1 Tax=Tropilaelaps mercedesae TaxID=418985 RepID=A0A1V9X178_9ACAR|nr:dimethylaniline monooxygenase-like [Tropilaelaps mercedesae]